MGESNVESAGPLPRQVGYVYGQWRVTYRCADGPDPEADVRRGWLVGPLVPDSSTALWVTVVPDGGKQRTMIRRDSITNIAAPRGVG
jgi:hypothetical protein